MDKRMTRKRIISYGRIAFISIAFFFFVFVSYEVHKGSDFFSVNLVFAQSQATKATTSVDEAKSTSVPEKNLMDNLLEKQKQLDNREKFLKEEERKIEELKKEVAEKMEALRVLQESMLPALEVQKAEKEKKYQVLAKMYEVTPPEKAAAIFEKMDRKMAAEIMLRMNSKKAGTVWAQINRDAGVEIIKEISSSQSVDAARAAKIAKDITEQAVSKLETVKSSDAVSATKKDKEIAPPEISKQESTQILNAKRPAKKELKTARVKNANLEKNVRSMTSKPFAIQIKAVRGIDMAREYTQLLKEEGIDAYWSEMNVKGTGTLYRVLVGHFASREEALKYMKGKRIDNNYPGSYILKSEQMLPPKKKKKK